MSMPSTFDDLQAETDGIRELLLDVLSSVLGEEALEAGHGLGAGPAVLARIAVHDEIADSYALVEVGTGTDLAEVLASRMMFIADPVEEDVLDAVAELGNICGGNLKSLLCERARLSLPSAEMVLHAPPDAPRDVHVWVVVLGHVVELTVHAADAAAVTAEGLSWPPGQLDEVLEGTR